MLDQLNAPPALQSHVPWNKGKLTGAKPPLRPKHVWSIRTKLQIEGRARDLAMFNLAIDSKLRGCDVVAIRVEDVAAGGYTADRASVRQRKTGRPVRFELSEQTRQAVDDYLKATNKRPGEFLFTGRRGPNTSMTTRQHARLVSEWIGGVALDVPTSWTMAVKVDEFTARMFEAINGMLLDMLAAVARKDYDDRRRRQAQGQAKAKAEGLYKGRAEDVERNDGISRMITAWSSIQAAMGCNRATIAKLAKRMKAA